MTGDPVCAVHGLTPCTCAVRANVDLAAFGAAFQSLADAGAACAEAFRNFAEVLAPFADVIPTEEEEPRVRWINLDES